MNTTQKHFIGLRAGLLAASGFALLAGSAFLTADAYAQDGERPSLIVTHAPLPQNILKNAYTKPVQLREIKAVELTGASYYKPTETLVTRKIADLSNDLAHVQEMTATLSTGLAELQRANEQKSADYYAAVATINTQLQSGTTPGNPRLLERYSVAEQNLEKLAGNITDLNQLAIDVSKAASEAAYLLESARAAYTVSGAVEEDHVRLAELEDTVSNTITIIERILNAVNDDISRTTNYLSAERGNLRTLSLAIAKGDFFGTNIANKSFVGASGGFDSQIGFDEAAVPQAQNLTPPQARPLVKIRFDRSDVAYEQPLYTAVNEALQRFPGARFDLIAVHPAEGNAAEVAIESTRARRNAERVLRSLTQMGLSPDQIDLSYDQSPEAQSNEVHLYIR